MEFLFDYGLWGLLVASFLAATLIPFSSDALLLLMVANGFAPIDCIVVATFGNWLGGMSSYFLGYLGKWSWIEKYLRVERQKIERWHNKLEKRGAIFAFLSWLPFVGDIFAVGLGILRTNYIVVATAMLIGKFLRYVIWAWLGTQF